jgi:hypothetical protein
MFGPIWRILGNKWLRLGWRGDGLWDANRRFERSRNFVRSVSVSAVE